MSHLPVGTVSQGCLARGTWDRDGEATACPSSTHFFGFKGDCFSFAYIFIFVVLGMEPRALCVVGKDTLSLNYTPCTISFVFSGTFYWNN